MSTSTEQQSQSSSLDIIKLAVSGALVVIAIGLFYYFATWQGQPVSLLYRVLGLLVLLGGAIALALSTESGRHLIAFMKDSRTEVRKMVWPTRAETMQTTLMVLVIVLILAIFLWLVDVFLGWGVKMLLGGG